MIKGTLVPSRINEDFSQETHAGPAVDPAILLCLAHCGPKGIKTWIPVVTVTTPCNQGEAPLFSSKLAVASGFALGVQGQDREDS